MKNYGFYGRLDEETTWDEDVELDAPALNISGFYFPSNDPVYGFDWEDPEKEKENWDERFPFRNLNKMEFTTSSESTYDMEYIKENGRCQPSSEVSPCALPSTNDKANQSRNGPPSFSTSLTPSPGLQMGRLLHPARHHGAGPPRLVPRCRHNVV